MAAIFESVADLTANVKQISSFISIALYVNLFVGVYIVCLTVYFYALAMWWTLSFAPHGIVLVVLDSS